MEEIEPDEYVEAMAIEMSDCYCRDRRDLLTAAFLYEEYNEQNIRHFLSYFEPTNIHIELWSSIYRFNKDGNGSDDENDDDSESGEEEDGSDDDSDNEGDSESSDDAGQEEAGVEENDVDLEKLYNGPNSWFEYVQNPFISVDECNETTSATNGAAKSNENKTGIMNLLVL